MRRLESQWSVASKTTSDLHRTQPLPISFNYKISPRDPWRFLPAPIRCCHTRFLGMCDTSVTTRLADILVPRVLAHLRRSDSRRRYYASHNKPSHPLPAKSVDRLRLPDAVLSPYCLSSPVSCSSHDERTTSKTLDRWRGA